MDKENEEIKVIKRSQTEMLERISGFTAEEAKNYLIAQVESEVTHETALKIKEIESRMKEECEASGPGRVVATGHPALRRRPRGRNDRQCGSPAQ